MTQMTLPSLFEKVTELKKERRDLKDSIKQQLEGHGTYQGLLQQAQEVRAQMKEIVREVTEHVAGGRLAEIATELKVNADLMTDVSLSMYVEGKDVCIKDKYERELRPQFTVKFIKA